MNHNNNKNNNKQHTNTPPHSNTTYSTEIENDTLRFWERAVLVIEAVHIAENKANISFQDFKASSNRLYKHIRQSILQKEDIKKPDEVDEKIKEVYNALAKLYGDMRNYLSILSHENISIAENIQAIVYSCYRVAICQYKQQNSPHFLNEKKFFKNNHFTLLGLLCFLCMGLERDRAYALCNRFAFANKQKTENQDVFDAIMAVIKCYGRKKSDKIKAHKQAGKEYQPHIQDEKKREDEEQERAWNLICEITDYITKPIEGSPNYTKEEYKNNKRSLNPYIVDNFIIWWITLESKIKDLEFATTGIQENKKKKNINIPVFDSNNGNYFRLNDQYWCRVRKKDTGQWIEFRMHRTHVLRLAKMILKGNKEGYIVTSIFGNIGQMQGMNDKNPNIRNSLPRCMRNDYTPATIEEKIAYRHKQYEKVHEIDERIYPSAQVQFILWALQGVLKETGENDPPLYLLEYQKISAMMHFYTVNFVQQFREKVCNALPERYAYCEKYIKPSLNQTLDCIVQNVTKALEQDTQALIDRQESVYKKHSFRFNRPQKDKHPLKETHKNDLRNIIWLSKQWGKEKGNEDYQKYTKDVQWDHDNYHEKIQILIEGNVYAIDDKEERRQVYNAADYYAKDRLLLEIAVDLMNSEFSYESKINKDSEFSIGIAPNIQKVKELEVIIKGSIRGESKEFRIPIRYLTKLSYVFYKKNLMDGIYAVQSRFDKEKEQNENYMEYFMQNIMPEFRRFGIEALKVIFDIESIVLRNMDRSIKEKAFSKYEYKYISFRYVLDLLKHDDKGKLKDIRNYILHEGIKDIFEKKDEYIRVIDAIAKELRIKNDLSTRLEQAGERRKEQRRERIKKYQMSKKNTDN